MATAEQENLYNEIIKYYSLTERLIEALEASQESLGEEKFSVVEDMILSLEQQTETLASTYIEYVQSGNAKAALQPVRDSLSAITAKVEECRNRFLALYHG